MRAAGKNPRERNLMSRVVAFQQIPYKFIAGEKVESERDHQCKRAKKGERDKKKAAKIYIWGSFARLRWIYLHTKIKRGQPNAEIQASTKRYSGNLNWETYWDEEKLDACSAEGRALARRTQLPSLMPHYFLCEPHFGRLAAGWLLRFVLFVMCVSAFWLE